MQSVRRKAYPVAVALALVLVVAGCVGTATTPPATEAPKAKAPAATQPAAKQTAAPKAGADLAPEVRMGMINIVENFEPHIAASPFSIIPIAQSFDGLTMRTAGGELVGALAARWEAIDDTTWEFELRENLVFHDGSPVTPEDVQFTIARIQDPEQQVPIADRVANIDRIEPTGERTLLLHTKEPDALLPARLADAKILPAAVFQELGAAEFSLRPVGTGPWKVKELVPNSYVLYEAFPDSWRATPEMPLARIVKIPEPASLVAAAQTQEIDIAYDIPADREADLAAEAHLEMVSFIRTSTHFIDLNYIQFEEFSDKRVRQAMNHAVDKDAVNQAVSGGHARIADGQLVPRGITGYNPDLGPFEYDLDRARQLMDEAGMADGFSTSLMVTVGTNVLVGEAVSGFLDDINVRVEINPNEFPVFLQKYLAGEKGPMFLWGTGYGNLMDADAPLTFFMSTQRPQIRRMENPEFDRLMQQSKVELDPDRRESLLQEAAAILREEAPGIFLFQQGYLVAVNTKVENFVERLDNVILFDEMRRRAD